MLEIGLWILNQFLRARCGVGRGRRARSLRALRFKPLIALLQDDRLGEVVEEPLLPRRVEDPPEDAVEGQ